MVSFLREFCRGQTFVLSSILAPQHNNYCVDKCGGTIVLVNKCPEFYINRKTRMIKLYNV